MLLAALGVMALLDGCAGSGSTVVTAAGRDLTIYVSAPAGTAPGSAAQDVLDAEQLAFSQKVGEVTSFKLSLSRLSASRLSDNARTAIQNTSAIAYLGEIVPGSSADTLGITNAQQLLQVSPSDTAVALTQKTAAVPGAPERYYESLKTYGRTFARVVPTTTPEARAQVRQMATLGVKQVYVTDDGSVYGRGLTAAIRAAPGGLAIRSGPPTVAGFTSSGADGLLFATASEASAAGLFAAVASAHPAVKLFAPSALADPVLASALGRRKLSLYVSTPGVLPHNLDPTGRIFLSSFQSTYHHAPVAQAIFGYEAMAAVIDVLREAGSSANDRATVVHDFFAIRNRASLLGAPYSIDVNGDSTIAPIVFERLQGGRLVPFAQASG